MAIGGDKEMKRCFETELSLQELLEEVIQNLVCSGLLLPSEDNEAAVHND
jgi:hypothetical protein